MNIVGFLDAIVAAIRFCILVGLVLNMMFKSVYVFES